MYGIAKALNGALQEAFLPILDFPLLGLLVAVVVIVVLSYTAARQNTSTSELVFWPSNVAKPGRLYSSCLKPSRPNFGYKQNATADPRRIWAPSDFEKRLTWRNHELPHVPPFASVTDKSLGDPAPVLSQLCQIALPPDMAAVHGSPDQMESILTNSRSTHYESITTEFNRQLGALEAEGGSHCHQPETLQTPSSPDSTSLVPIKMIKCTFPGCERTFQQKHEYNRHKRSHIHPKKCSQCGMGFETGKDVTRHINSVHTTTKRFFCTFVGCKYSRLLASNQEGGFPRKDNWRRHMKSKHGLSEDQIPILEGENEE